MSFTLSKSSAAPSVRRFKSIEGHRGSIYRQRLNVVVLLTGMTFALRVLFALRLRLLLAAFCLFAALRVFTFVLRLSAVGRSLVAFVEGIL